jgi:hypothetical protein
MTHAELEVLVKQQGEIIKHIANTLQAMQDTIGLLIQLFEEKKK